jgi:dUTP pyrophosphatase
MKYTKIREVKTPNRGSYESAGLDFFIPKGLGIEVGAGNSELVPSGIKVNIPEGTMFQVCNKSGRAVKGLIVGACIIDSDYQGELMFNVWNISDNTIKIGEGEKLVQLVLVPILLPTLIEVKEEDLFSATTSRGDGGFGSTGVN